MESNKGILHVIMLYLLTRFSLREIFRPPKESFLNFVLRNLCHNIVVWTLITEVVFVISKIT